MRCRVSGSVRGIAKVRHASVAILEMSSRSVIRVMILAIMAVSGAMMVAPAAEAQTPPQVQITNVDASAWPTVQATVTVLDERGQPMTGLASEAFGATVAGSGVPMVGFNTASDPGLGMAVVLVFDVSGSMAGAPLAEAQVAGAALLQHLGQDDVVAVVSFADGVSVAQGFTTDLAAAQAAIQGLQAGGNTALYGAVQQAIELSQTAPVTRRAVVLLSDGYDFGGLSAVDAQTSLATAANAGTLIFGIGLGSEIDQGYLSALASAGRGQLQIAPQPEALTGLYQAAAAVLRQQYVLTLDAGSLLLRDSAPNLRVEVAAGGATGASEAVFGTPETALAAIEAEQPAVAPPPVPAIAPVVESSGGGGIPSYLPVIVGLVFVGAGVIFLFSRRLVPVGVPAEISRPIARGYAVPDYPNIPRAVDVGPQRAWLEGPGGIHASLGEDPVTIGFGRDCSLELPNGSDQHHERARIWRRDGRYMLHNLSRIGNLTVGGRPATWVILEDGDEIAIGPTRLIFRDASGAD